MHYNEVSFQKLPECFGNDFENSFEDNVWNLKHNVEKLQEVQNRIMQGIMSIGTSALVFGGVVQVAISAMSLAHIIAHALLFHLVLLPLHVLYSKPTGIGL